MRKITLFPNVILLSLFFVKPAIAQDYKIYFDFNSDQVRTDNLNKLKLLTKGFDPEKENILIVGHTDTVGNQNFNLDLSRRRTNTVLKYLTSHGIAAASISSDFKGKTQIVNDDQFYNRRVEIYVMKKLADKISYPQFKETLKPQAQSFTVSSSQDVKIEGDHGTLIKIPANSFVSMDGKPVTGDVAISLTEYYSMGDFFSSNLSTRCGDEIISSAGMIKITARTGEKEVKLKSTASMEINFPKNDAEDYSTFYGERNKQGIVEWKQQETQTRLFASYPPETKASTSTNPQSDWQFTTPGAPSPASLGLTIGNDGKSLVITDRKTADERNQKMLFHPIKQRFISPDSLSEKDKSEIVEYLKEQKEVQERSTQFYNTITANKLGMINCDRFYNSPNSILATIEVDATEDDIKVESAGLIIRGINSYLPFYCSAGTVSSYSANLPTNLQTELFVMGTKNGKVFFYKGPLKIQKATKAEVELQPSTFEQVQREIAL